MLIKSRVRKSLPTPSDLHISAALTTLAIGWKQDSKRFVAGQVFPEVPVPKASDFFFIWDQGDFFRDEAQEAAPGTPPPLQNLRLSNSKYTAKVYHLGGLIGEEDLVNQDPAVNKEMSFTRATVMKLLIRREKIWQANYFTTGVWTGSTTGTDLVGDTDFAKWSNYAASDPIIDIDKQCRQLELYGLDRNDFKLTVGSDVWSYLRNHPKLLERYEFTQAAILDTELVAKALGVGQVLVAKASSSTSAEGSASPTLSYINSGSALLTYSPPAPAIDLPSAGYHFTWAGLIGSVQEGIRIRRWWDPDIRSWKIVGETAFDAKVTSSVLGVFFSVAV